MKIVIINYGAGNIQSIKFAIQRLGYEAVLSHDEEEIRNADKVIFPGVGEASSAMEKLKSTGLDKVIPTLKQPVLGICLGMQSIGAAYGGDVVRAPEVMHGKTSEVHHTGKGVFKDLPSPFTATRYHSLVVDPKTLPDCLEVTAWTLDDRGEREVIMGLRHRDLAVEGVQFHPESILTEHGHAMLQNFLNQAS